MSKTIDRDARIKQIQTQIEQCKAYQKLDPDPSVADRLSKLEKNPCIEGLYYLNAVYKDMQYERSTTEALKYRETIWLNIPYTSTEYSFNGYIVKSQGFWQKNLVEGIFYSLSELKNRTAELTKEGLIADEDFIAYIDITPIKTKLEENILNEYNPTIDVGEQREPIKYKIFSSTLDSFFNNYFVTTSSVIAHVENTSLLEKLPGVPICQTLFNWTKWEILCNDADERDKIKQEEARQKTAAENLNTNGLSTTPDYVNNWRFGITIGPEAVDHYYTFKSLSKNAFKPNLEKEKKEIEDKYPKVPIYKTDANGNVVEPLKKIGERFPDNWPFIKLYIDTIDYDEWEQKIDKLNVLATKYSQLPEKIEVSDDDEPKKDNGESYEPLCDKYFPMDVAGIFDIIPDVLKPPLFTVEELLYYPDGSPYITYTWENNKWVRKTRN